MFAAQASNWAPYSCHTLKIMSNGVSHLIVFASVWNNFLFIRKKLWQWKVPAKCEFRVVWNMTPCSLVNSCRCFGSIISSPEHRWQFIIDPAFYFKRREHSYKTSQPRDTHVLTTVFLSSIVQIPLFRYSFRNILPRVRISLNMTASD